MDSRADQMKQKKRISDQEDRAAELNQTGQQKEKSEDSLRDS